MPHGADEVAVGPNEALRFVLEIAALFALGYAGWNLTDGFVVSATLAMALPLVGATVWGVFRVDGDPKVAPVPVPGVVRLCIEVDFFTTAVILLAVVGRAEVAGVLAVLVLAHYAWGRDRVRWLVRHPGRLPEMREG